MKKFRKWEIIGKREREVVPYCAYAASPVMTLEACVENGQIVLPSPLELPDGTRVDIAPILSSDADERTPDSANPSLYDRMQSVIGIAKNLPPDASRNIDHY